MTGIPSAALQSSGSKWRASHADQSLRLVHWARTGDEGNGEAEPLAKLRAVGPGFEEPGSEGRMANDLACLICSITARLCDCWTNLIVTRPS
jgi:hypothetical protein